MEIVGIIALVCVYLICKFCENLTLRVWGFIATILSFIFILSGGFEGLLLISIVMPIIVLPIWIITLAILRYGFKKSISPSLVFSTFSFVVWYALNLILNIFVLIICCVIYLINLKKSRDFTPYLLHYAQATGATLYIFTLIGKISRVLES
ncbi:hypothetical protein [Campylobacter porcelli]|uniref:Putative membrane protein n=1 Tax=Campylobacter porcelli TaxID=1660073 RepID=A0A1X9SVY6_9BACT|nr:hypothetical protein [Campylobacter sp. RM6137]ARR00427.1 putative membrane protein [Campylobacter sp. RM6137]